MAVISAIIPAFNEEVSIAAVLSDMPEFISEVVVVDNGSTDDTANIARQHGATVLIEKRRGYGSACLAGIDHLSKSNTDVIVFLDGDYSDRPSEMNRLLKPILDDGYDMVIGSRLLGHMEPGSMTFPQRFGNQLSSLLMRMLFRAHFTDLGPFRAVRLQPLLKMDMQEKDYGWTVEMQLKAVKNHLRYTEVPVSYYPRLGGRSKVSGTVKGTILAGYKILVTIFKHY